MASQSRIIDLISKINPDVFKIVNKDIFGTTDQPLGSNQGAVNRILMNHEHMLKVLMPSIIVTSPDDPTWYKRVSNYWNSLTIKVPIGGKRLETGYNFSLTDSSRSSYLADLKVAAKKQSIELDTDEALKDYVLKYVPENERYKYASPINVIDYLIWIYCLGHREVAKQVDHIEKSTNIKFLLIDPKDIEDSRKAQHVVSIEATKKYLEILVDRKKVKDILYIRGENASKLDDLDADSRLKTFADAHPKEFLAIVNDPDMMTRARIERYCITGILKKLPNSSIIVDGQDTGVLIGNTMEEAILFFKSESSEKASKVKEFSTRYQQKIKVNQ